jgi:hypothetical protein
MPDEQLKDSFTGDARGLERAANNAATALNKVEKEAGQASTAIGNIPKGSKQAETALLNASKASEKVTASLKTQITVSDQASQAAARMASGATAAGGSIAKTTTNFTGLTRVIQDLPFGFIAISNNLEQLLPAAGGLGLAFSAIVAAISFAQLGLSNWTRGLKGSQASIDDNTISLGLLGKELENIKDDIDDFNNALDYANKIGKIRVDINIGKGLKADLLDLRGQSIGNLTLTDQLEKEGRKAESIASEIRKNLIEDLTLPENDRFFKAFDKGALDALDDVPDKIKKQYDKLKKAEKTQKDVSEQIVKARENQNVIYAQIKQKKIDIQEDSNKKADEASKKALADQKKRQREAEENLKKYLEERSRIIAEASKDFAEIKIFTLPDVGDPKDNTVLFQRLQKNLVEQARKLLPVNIKLPAQVEFDATIHGLDATKTIPLKIQPSIQMDIDAAERAQKEMEQLIASFNNSLQGTVTGAVGNIAESIGAAIAGDSFENVFKTIIGSAGDFLQQLGKLLIQIAIKIELFKKALFTWAVAHPALAIAAGVGLIAAGAFIKSTVLPKPKGFAEGGLVSGPVLGLVGEGPGTNRSNPEVIAPLNKLKDMIGSTSTEFPQYLPVFSMSHDKFRLWYARANSYGNTFGR